MLKSILIAFLFVGSVGLALSQESSRQDEERRLPQPASIEEKQPANTSEAFSSPSSTIVSKDQPAKSERESSSKNWSKIFVDHLPDWFVAFFTAVLSLFTYKLWRATAGLWEATNGLLRFAGEQASDMKASIEASSDANALARTHFSADQRPWIAVINATLASPVAWEDKGARFTARCTFKNIGKTPATHFFAEAIATADPNVEAAASKHAAEVLIRRSGENATGPVLFPGQEREINFGLLIFRDEIIKHIFIQDGGFFMSSIFGCVTYRYSESTELHQTGFTYLLLKAPSTMLALTDGDLPVGVVGLAETYYGGVAT